MSSMVRYKVIMFTVDDSGEFSSSVICLCNCENTARAVVRVLSTFCVKDSFIYKYFKCYYE